MKTNTVVTAGFIGLTMKASRWMICIGASDLVSVFFLYLCGQESKILLL